MPAVHGRDHSAGHFCVSPHSYLDLMSSLMATGLISNLRNVGGGEVTMSKSAP